MNKADLEKLGLTAEVLEKAGLTADVLDKILATHSKDIEKHKTQVTDLTKQIETVTGQLTDANKQIESFKSMDVETIKKTADEYKTKFEQAQTDAKNQLAQLKFDHALESALTTAKAKSPKAVKALLEMQNLKLNEADGSIIGLEDQLKTVKEKNDYLFDSETSQPAFGGSGGNQSVITDAFEAAMWKGAGLKPPEAK